MSPEQIEGLPLDPRADLYCLGLLLYEMLAGQPPFASESPRELLNLHCTQPPPPLPPDVRAQLPQGLEALMLSLLAKGRDQRPPSAASTRRALEQILEPAAPPIAAGAAAAAAVPAPNLPAGPARSTGTIMLIERAGQAQSRGQTMGIVLAIVGVVLLVGGGVTAWVLFGGERARASPKTSTPATAPAKTKAKTNPPKADPPQPEDDPAKAEAERKAVQAAAERERADNPSETKDDDPPKDPTPSPGVLSSLGLGGGGDDPPKADDGDGGGSVLDLLPSRSDESKADEGKADDSKAEPGAGDRLLNIFAKPGEGE